MRTSKDLLGIILSTFACVGSTDAQKKGTIVEGSLGRRLDAHVSSLDRESGGLCGSALVARGRKILLMKGYGVAEAKSERRIRSDALWDWASVTKQFTAAAILRLEMAKKLSIDDPIRKFYPDTPDEKAGITLRHLLNHTSGIRPGLPPGKRRPNANDRDAVVALFLSQPLEAAPGERWAYSNLAYVTLAAVVERVGRIPFERYCAKYLFRPAGMKKACFIGDKRLDLDRVPRQDRGKGAPFAYGTKLTWAYRGCGGAVVELRDMHRWDRALRGSKVLSGRAKEQYYSVGRNDYALGWFVRKRGGDIVYSHSGSVGTNVTYYYRTLRDEIVVALAYSHRPGTHPAVTADALAAIVRGDVR